MSLHPDAELLTLCATVQAVQNEIEAGYPFKGKRGELRLSKLSDRSWGAAAKASVCQAITAEGRLAKAAMALRMLDIEPECHHEQGAVIAMRALRSLLQDADADRALIADCATFEALERQVHEIHGDEPEKDAERDRLGQLQDPVVDRIVDAEARTLAGQAARARCLIEWDASVVAPGSGDTYERITHALLSDLVGAEFVADRLERMRLGNMVGTAADSSFLESAFVKPGAQAPTSIEASDGELIRIGDEFVRSYERVLGMQGEGPLRHLVVSDTKAGEKAVERIREECERLLREAWDLEAVTPAGILARCRMMIAFWGDAEDSPHGYWPDLMIMPLLRDVGNMEGNEGQ